MNLARIRWYRALPAAFVEAQTETRATYFIHNPDGALPPFHTGVGQLASLNDSNAWYLFYDDETFTSGQLVAYELAQGSCAKYAVNLRKVLAVPFIAHLRVE